MMAIKGYFRAPTRLQGRKQQAAERGFRGDRDDSLAGAALLDELPAVPRGYFAVYVGAEARRFVVPTAYLRQPAFRDLMERAAEEFGFAQAAGIRIPCREEDFQATLAALDLECAVARGPAPAEPPLWRSPNCPRPVLGTSQAAMHGMQNLQAMEMCNERILCSSS